MGLEMEIAAIYPRSLSTKCTLAILINRSIAEALSEVIFWVTVKQHVFELLSLNPHTISIKQKLYPSSLSGHHIVLQIRYFHILPHVVPKTCIAEPLPLPSRYKLTFSAPSFSLGTRSNSPWHPYSRRPLPASAIYTAFTTSILCLGNSTVSISVILRRILGALAAFFHFGAKSLNLFAQDLP